MIVSCSPTLMFTVINRLIPIDLSQNKTLNPCVFWKCTSAKYLKYYLEESTTLVWTHMAER